MKGIGEGIAFSAFVVCSTFLKIHGHDVKLMWFIVIVWIISSNWGQK